GSYEALYRQTSFAHVTAVGGPAAEVLAAGAEMPQLEASTTRTVADVPFLVGEDHSLLGRVVGMPAAGRATVNDIRLTDGRGLDPAVPDGVVVEQHMAAHFGLTPGDDLSISTPGGWTTARVLGVAASPEYLWPAKSRQEVLVLPDDFGVVFAPESFVQRLAPAAQRSEVLFRLADDVTGADVEAAREAVLAAGALDAFTLDEQPSNAALQEDVTGFAEMSVMFPSFFLIAAAFATYVMLGRMIAAQTANIGTIRALGFGSRTITWHYAAIGAIVGVVASVAGVLLGSLLAEAITRLYTGTLSIPAAVVEVRPGTVAIGFLTGVLTGLLAAWLPARAAGRISPATAMRGQLPPGGGGESLFERLIPPLRGLPVRWLQVVRGLGRARRRSVASIVGAMLATMLILVSWGMVDTVQVLLDRQFVQIQRYDAQLHLSRSAEVRADIVAAEVAATDGVAAVEQALVAPVSVTGPAGAYSTTLTALEPDARMHVLMGTDGSALPVPAEGVVLGRSLHGRLGVDVGDPVTIGVAGVAVIEDVPVAGFVDEPLGTYAYASLPYASGLLHEVLGPLTAENANPANLLMLSFDESVDGSAMRARLGAIEGVEAYVDSQALYALAQELMALFYVFIGVMLVLGGVLAFALIYNTMSANISERQGELAVLRTLGLSRRVIGSMVTAQNLILTLIGLVPGLVFGWLLAWVFMGTFSSDMFTFELQVQPLTFVMTAVAIIFVGLLSQWPALRAVGRLELGRIVRERSF
ncbi:MAG: FtsX-like permease family protein, partial [Candidatus Limnocylindrales bacterium]